MHLTPYSTWNTESCGGYNNGVILPCPYHIVMGQRSRMGPRASQDPQASDPIKRPPGNSCRLRDVQNDATEYFRAHILIPVPRDRPALVAAHLHHFPAKPTCFSARFCSSLTRRLLEHALPFSSSEQVRGCVCRVF